MIGQRQRAGERERESEKQRENNRKIESKRKKNKKPEDLHEVREKFDIWVENSVFFTLRKVI